MGLKCISDLCSTGTNTCMYLMRIQMYVPKVTVWKQSVQISHLSQGCAERRQECMHEAQSQSSTAEGVCMHAG